MDTQPSEKNTQQSCSKLAFLFISVYRLTVRWLSERGLAIRRLRGLGRGIRRLLTLLCLKRLSGLLFGLSGSRTAKGAKRCLIVYIGAAIGTFF